MANSLLDFVMSLVRDPDAAARYAADPAQVLADAHLPDVTTADVQDLMPVVTESLSMSAPAHTAFGGEQAANVWASGAATAAFDAFDDPSVADAEAHVPTIVDHLDQQWDVPTVAEPTIPDQLPVAEPVVDDHWAAAAPDVLDDLPLEHGPDPSLEHPLDHGPGFDLFD